MHKKWQYYALKDSGATQRKKWEYSPSFRFGGLSLR